MITTQSRNKITNKNRFEERLGYLAMLIDSLMPFLSLKLHSLFCNQSVEERLLYTEKERTVTDQAKGVAEIFHCLKVEISSFSLDRIEEIERMARHHQMSEY